MKRALLLSGGMDSIGIAYWKRPTLAITIDYGQRSASAEIRAASAVCIDLGIEHSVIRADLSALGSGDLAGTVALEIAAVPEWWPFRNQMLVTLAAMRCVARDHYNILIGTVRTDSAHADGSARFIGALDALLRIQEGGVTLEAPAIDRTAAELIRESGVPMEILAWSHSCHVAEHACGVCRGCRKHYDTMAELGVAPY
jgi:7-cyano-7-deazaguanine synthase